MPAQVAVTGAPAILDDGTLSALVAAPARVENGALTLSLLLPARVDAGRVAGRFLLTRCGAQSPEERASHWSIYLRRPLFAASRPQPLPGEPNSLWRVVAPWQDDPGLAWLAARQEGETVNLAGPYGSGFPLLPLTRRLLLIADAPHLGMVLPLLDEALDRGGQVSLLLLDGGSAPANVDALRRELPLAVEFHRLTAEGRQQEIDAGLRWSDQVCTAVALAHLPSVADAIRRIRVRFDAGFAFSFVDADLACGYGACLACVVPLANGNLTRACLHGPVFDLLELTGRG
jgi:dihydroorotate dehydrogenase electron transfer subunit